MDVVNLDRVAAFITADGSEIRELLAHRNSCIRKQSLAEARLPTGGATTPHFHEKTEEIYYILEGQAEMRIGDDVQTVGPGDAIAIPPGAIHTILNSGEQELRFLCCCAPPYEHDDTILVE
ncbi:MAG: cupin domain-containing protein [Pirellulaceae bacterium]|nr:cupin domain-containing protein [Pirellulaceae bacterium]